MSSEHKRVQSVWQNQPMEEITMSLSDLEGRARAFENRVRMRNLVLYAYSAFNIMASVVLIAAGYFPTMRYPMILMILAHLFVLWQVVHRAGAREVPSEGIGKTAVAFMRQEFERQRKALSSAWLWYIVPFMPAFLWELGIWYAAISAHAGSPGSEAGMRRFAIVIATAIVFWGTVFALFQRGAHRYARRIGELDRLSRE